MFRNDPPQDEFSGLSKTPYDAGSASHQILEALYLYHCGNPLSGHYCSQTWSKPLIAEKLGDKHLLECTTIGGRAFWNLRLLARATARFGLSPSETEEIGKGVDTLPRPGKFRLNHEICKRRDASMMVLKSGQYKQ